MVPPPIGTAVISRFAINATIIILPILILVPNKHTKNIILNTLPIIDPSLMTLSQQIQDTLAAVDFTSICKPILEQQEQMKKICEDMFVSESIEQIKVVMQQSERVVNIASKVLSSISSAINLIDGDNVDNIISSLEIPKFKNALYDSLEEISPDTEISIESLTDSITDYYEIETEQEEETLSGIQKASHKKSGL